GNKDLISWCIGGEHENSQTAQLGFFVSNAHGCQNVLTRGVFEVGLYALARHENRYGENIIQKATKLFNNSFTLS
ncbi:MAG TPA: hypothetical protein PLB62_14815, partial [Candidatus Sumerlaeota bacterium]|nr:hypothetical protein [Candidatus Sumerlaeota bacterium]